jgi:hypothetical protein
VGAAELSLATPQGAVEFSWRHVPACKDLHVAGGWVAGPWQVDGFEANVTLPLQLPTPPRVHLPLPRSTREGLTAAASALEQGVEIREAVRKTNAFFWNQFYAKIDLYAKTGSGQT